MFQVLFSFKIYPNVIHRIKQIILISVHNNKHKIPFQKNLSGD